MADNILTAAELKRHLSYDPDTGVFTRLSTGNPLRGERSQKGYVLIRVNSRRKYRAHRLAWLYVYDAWPAQDLDHANRIKTDNRIANLRIITPSQQAQNTIKSRVSTAGFRGVYTTAEGRFRARVKVNGRKHDLGTFDTAKQAYAAYLEGAAKYHTHNPLLSESDATIISASHGGHNMLMTRDEAQQILATAKRTVNNRRAYAHHGAVWYPIATLVWVAHTGEWPKSTPRHLNNDPLDNRFENLRAPGRAVKPRKKAAPTIDKPIDIMIEGAYREVDLIKREVGVPPSLFA